MARHGRANYLSSEWMACAYVFNNYGMGTDTLGVPDRSRLHADYSVEVKYYDKPENVLDKMAFSLTGDAGCEYGGGVSCYHNSPGGPKQSFLGFMVYDRIVVSQRQVRSDAGRRGDEQSRPLSGAIAADQWSGRDFGLAIFPGSSRTAIQSVGCVCDISTGCQSNTSLSAGNTTIGRPTCRISPGPGGLTPSGGNTGTPGVTVPVALHRTCARCNRRSRWRFW